MIRTSRRLSVVVALAAMALVAASCSQEVDVTVTSAPTTSTTVPPPPIVWPLTGLPAPDEAATQQTAVVAKIDNSSDARPHGGINQADLVYEVQVEGITRFAAVFHSQVPDRVGPVRSARSTDVDLVANLGSPILVWSGGNSNVIGEINAAANAGLLINGGYDAAPGDYQRVSGRFAPHNLFANVAGVRDGLGRPGEAFPKPLFTYRTESAPAPRRPGSTTTTLPPSGDPVPGITISWDLGSSVTYVWDPEAGCNPRFQDGALILDEAGESVCPRNVVIQYTPYGPSTADSRSPQAYTVGNGSGLVYTGGRLTTVLWDRPDQLSGPNLFLADLSPAQLTPGNTWVALPPPDQTVTNLTAEQADALR